ncbi:MAG: FHA domain-containing protein [Myxococcales bacterium]|nr:FHA domain-containing protein [Myxococcales bacterium]
MAQRGPITSLRFAGRPWRPLALSTAQASFSIGAEACDLVVVRADAPGLSAYHARLERTQSGLRVHDQGSKNGVYASPSTGRVASLEVEAGDRFWLGDLELLALDPELEVLRPALGACLGLGDDARIDRALTLAAQGGPVALIGAPGTGAARLARQLHDASTRRASFFLALTATPLPPLDHATGGTVFVDLEGVQRVTASAAASLFATPPRLRPIFAAGSARRLRARLDRHADEVAVIELVPLAQRPQDVAPLLAQHWVSELHSRRRVAELGDGLAGLEAHTWPGNLDELYEHAPRLLAYLEHGTLRAAAAALGVRHQTLAGHLERLGLVVGRRAR